MELLSKRIRTLTIGLEGSVSNACRQFLLKRIFAMQFAELEITLQRYSLTGNTDPNFIAHTKAKNIYTKISE